MDDMERRREAVMNLKNAKRDLHEAREKRDKAREAWCAMTEAVVSAAAEAERRARADLDRIVTEWAIGNGE